MKSSFHCIVANIPEDMLMKELSYDFKYSGPRIQEMCVARLCNEGKYDMDLMVMQLLVKVVRLGNEG